MCTRVPQEPGRPRRLHRSPGRAPRLTSPGSRNTALGVRGERTASARWYRRAKATKRRGTNDEESEHLIVPVKRGNRPEGPRRGNHIDIEWLREAYRRTRKDGATGV